MGYNLKDYDNLGVYMTEKLFDIDSHLLAFDARVLACDKCENGFWVLLDATAFAPEGGGQPSDLGTLGNIEVLDVREREGEIWHLLDGELAVGLTVHGEVDATRRLRHLQNHTGEHIVTGLFYREYGMNNVGFHLGREDVTLDLDGSVDLTMLRRIEHLANLAVAENRKVNILYPDDETLKTMFYRSKKEVEGRVRIVEIEGLDRCACCVPHVKFTGEVGGIRLLSALRYKGGTRIHMKCGMDAIAHSDVQQDREDALCMLLSLPSDRILDGVKKLMDDLSAAKYKLVGMRREQAEAHIRAIDPKETCVCLFLTDFEVNELRALALGVAQKTGGVCGAFSAMEDGGYRFALADVSGSFEDTAKRFRERFSAKGGGKAPVLQGTFEADEDSIRTFFGRIIDEIANI